MDAHVPLDQRQEAAALAAVLRYEADAARSRELAAAELGAPRVPAQASPVVVETPTRVPRQIATIAVSPSVAAARAAVAEASLATGTESPADAGASFARPGRAQLAVAAAPDPIVMPRASAPALAAAARDDPPAPRAVATASNGPWRVQLGAFSLAGNADKLWSELSGRTELSGAKRLLVPAGAVTRLQAGGFTSRAAADAACRSLKKSGHDCLVTRG